MLWSFYIIIVKEIFALMLQSEITLIGSSTMRYNETLGFARWEIRQEGILSIKYTPYSEQLCIHIVTLRTYLDTEE